ncbi:tyrosine-type recombinase/integrase [Dysgonomonas sp. Marseille-P4677]|nr:tyrosine-type recombinase/integrase [Dysgonomonas sp. Marseille-P4677]
MVEELLRLYVQKSTEKIFQPLTNQATNRNLKEIVEDLGIAKTMTFHTARHTFKAITVRKGIRDCVAERMMGHSEGKDIKDIYTHL